MPQISKVGDGWAIPDYIDLPTWQATESTIDYGVPAEAACKGFCGEGNLNGTFPNGALVYTDGAIYDGTNDTTLATVKRLKLNNAGIIAKYIKCLNEYTWDYALTSNGAGSYAQYCFIDDTSGGSNGAVDVYGTGDGKVINSVIKTNSSKVFKIGYNRPYHIESNIVFGCTGTALTKSGTGQIARNNFFFNNLVDYGAKAEIFEQNASQDLTGTTGLTGYTSAELVDFARGDYRIKATSPLATASATGGYIGAFVEQASATESYSGSISGNVSFSTELTTEKQAFSNIDIAINNFSELITKKSIFNAIDAQQYFTTSISSQKSLSSNVLSNNTFFTEISSKKSAYASVSSIALFSTVITGTAAEIISKFGAINALNYFSSETKGVKKSNSSIVSTSSFYVTNSGQKISLASVDNSHSVVALTTGYKSVSTEINTQISFNNAVSGVNTEIAYTTIVRTISINSDIVSVDINTNRDNTLVIDGNIMSEINISGQI